MARPRLAAEASATVRSNRYVHNNLECVVSLLDYVAHKEPQPAYVYASSSSVYGLNKQIPFSERHAIDHPANLYGTSKFADEQIAAACVRRADIFL